MINVLITGSGGFVGSKIYSYLKENDYSVYGLDIRQSNTVDQICDLQDIAEIKAIIENFPADVVIHTAKLAKSLDYSEDNIKETYQSNHQTTLNLIKSIQKLPKVKFIYFSSDYVYAGKKNNYSEDDTPNPLNYYALTKLLGEEVTKTLDDYIILRPTVVYGWHPKGMNFLMQSIRNNQSKTQMKVPIDQISNPIHVDLLVKSIEIMIKKNITGIFNATGPETLNRYEFACKIAKIFEFSSDLFTPVKTSNSAQVAKRPLSNGTNSRKIQETLNFEFPSIEKSLMEIKKEAKLN
jgi:dTDP-4-dehydrorhamnose reductase